MRLKGSSRKLRRSSDADNFQRLGLVATCVSRCANKKKNRSATVAVNVLYDSSTDPTPRNAPHHASYFLDASLRSLYTQDPCFPGTLHGGANSSSRPPHQSTTGSLNQLVKLFVPRREGRKYVQTSHGSNNDSVLLLVDDESCETTLLSLIRAVQEEYARCRGPLQMNGIDGNFSADAMQAAFPGCDYSSLTLSEEKALEWLHSRFCLVRLDDLFTYITSTGDQHGTLGSRFGAVCGSGLVDLLNTLQLNTVGLSLPTPAPLFDIDWVRTCNNATYVRQMEAWQKNQDCIRSNFLWEHIFKLSNCLNIPTLGKTSTNANLFRVASAIPTASQDDEAIDFKTSRFLARVRATHAVALACVYSLGLGGVALRGSCLQRVPGHVTSGNSIVATRGEFQTVTLSSRENKLDESVLQAFLLLSDQTSFWDPLIRELLQRTFETNGGSIPDIPLPSVIRLVVSFCGQFSRLFSDNSSRFASRSPDSEGDFALLKEARTASLAALYNKLDISDNTPLCNSIRDFLTHFMNHLGWAINSSRLTDTRRRNTSAPLHIPEILQQMPTNTTALEERLITDIVQCLQSRLSPVLIRYLTEECNVNRVLSAAIGQAASNGAPGDPAEGLSQRLSEYVANRCKAETCSSTLSSSETPERNQIWRLLNSNSSHCNNNIADSMNMNQYQLTQSLESTLSGSSQDSDYYSYSFLIGQGDSSQLLVLSLNCLCEDPIKLTANSHPNFIPSEDASNVHRVVITTCDSGYNRVESQLRSTSDECLLLNYHADTIQEMHFSKSSFQTAYDSRLQVESMDLDDPITTDWYCAASLQNIEQVDLESAGKHEYHSAFVMVHFLRNDVVSEPLAVIVRTVILHTCVNDPNRRSATVKRVIDDVSILACFNKDQPKCNCDGECSNGDSWTNLARYIVDKIPRSLHARNLLRLNEVTVELPSVDPENTDVHETAEWKFFQKVMCSGHGGDEAFTPLTTRCFSKLNKHVRVINKFRDATCENLQHFGDVLLNQDDDEAFLKCLRSYRFGAITLLENKGRSAADHTRACIPPFWNLFGFLTLDQDGTLDAPFDTFSMTHIDDGYDGPGLLPLCKKHILDTIATHPYHQDTVHLQSLLHHNDIGSRLYALQSFLGLLRGKDGELGTVGLPRVRSSTLQVLPPSVGHKYSDDIAVISLARDCAHREALACTVADHSTFLDTCILLTVISFAVSSKSDPQPLVVYLPIDEGPRSHSRPDTRSQTPDFTS